MPKRCLITTIALLLVLLLINSNYGRALSDNKQEPKTQRKKTRDELCLEENIKYPGLPCAIPTPTDTIGPSESPLPVSTPSETPSPYPTPSETPKHKNFTLPLPGYKTGYFLHDNALQYCDFISQRISAEISEEDMPKIIITGYADGGKNIGILKGKETPTDRCHIVQGERINDEDLARLRSCVIWDLLLISLEKEDVVIGYGWGKTKLENIFGWDKDKIEDIKDGGSTEEKDRKVIVEVIW